MSEVLDSLRSDLESLCEEGLVNKVTLRDFEQRNSVQKWERGETKPTGAYY